MTGEQAADKRLEEYYKNRDEYYKNRDEYYKSLENKNHQKSKQTGKIGNLGKLIVFRVSDKKILTFNGFQQEISGRWSEHKG